MTDIGFCAKALNAWSIAAQNAYIMEHRRLFKEFRVELQLRMLPGNQQTTVCHLATMYHQYPPEFVLRRIILIYYTLVIHYAFLSIQAMVSPWRICCPGFTLISTSLPPMAAGISTISPHFVWR